MAKDMVANIKVARHHTKAATDLWQATKAQWVEIEQQFRAMNQTPALALSHTSWDQTTQTEAPPVTTAIATQTSHNPYFVSIGTQTDGNGPMAI